MRAITYSVLALFGIAAWAGVIALAVRVLPALVAESYLVDLWLVAHCGVTVAFLIEVAVAFVVCLAIWVCADWLLGDRMYTPKRYRETPYVCGTTPMLFDGQGDLIVCDPDHVAPSLSTPAAKGGAWRQKKAEIV